jgi:hypothetical protein
MNILRSFTVAVGAAACLSSFAAAQRQSSCPAGQAQNVAGKCVPVASAKKSTDDCAARGMVLKGGRCVKECPSGTTQGPTGKCVPAASAKKSTDDCAARGMVLKGGRCVKECPSGTTQGPTGKCVKAGQ